MLGARAQVAQTRADEAQMSVNPDAPVKLGVNGFGRIGRQVVRIAMEHPEFVVKHINSPMSPEYMKYQLEHDTIHGRFKGTVEITDTGLKVNGLDISLSATRDPTEIPWKDTGVDYVCESTGAFCTTEGCMKHIEGGAKKVVISAPAKDADTPTIVVGVNTEDYDSKTMNVVSNASCTTNCLAPMVKVLHDKWGIERGFMSTIHSYTGDQNLLDAPHGDLRRARSAAVSIVPSSTGAARAIGLVIPELQGKLNGGAFRVPTPTGSLTDFVAELKDGVSVTAEEVNAAFQAAASEGPMASVLEYSEEPLVLADVVGNPHSSIFDSGLTTVLEGNMVKVCSWYDNEWGYSCRAADAMALLAG